MNSQPKAVSYQEWEAANPEKVAALKAARIAAPVSITSDLSDLAIGVTRLVLVVGCLVGLVMALVAIL